MLGLFKFKCFVLSRQIMSMSHEFKLLLCLRDKLGQNLFKFKLVLL